MTSLLQLQQAFVNASTKAYDTGMQWDFQGEVMNMLHTFILIPWGAHAWVHHRIEPIQVT